MSVKRKTFYHIALFLPYFVLLISGVFTYLIRGWDVFNETTLSSLSIFAGVMIFFTIAGIIWGPLYTWMVVALLFWERDKDIDQIRRMYLLSPLLLACSMGIPALLINFPDSGIFLLWGFLRMNNLDSAMPFLFRNDYHQQSITIGVAWAFMAALCIVVGYAFVGLVLLIEKGMKKRGAFREEGDIRNSETVH